MKKRAVLTLIGLGIAGGCLLMEEPDLPPLKVRTTPAGTSGPIQTWPSPVVIDSVAPDTLLADGDTVRIFYRTTHRHQPRTKERD